MVRDTGELEDAIDYAFKLANDGKKGAVHIDIPKCVSTNIFEKKDMVMPDVDCRDSEASYKQGSEILEEINKVR